ncbi:MAG: ABC transporter permease [Actinomycetota bacterium]|nr:ABC transporter permease [Actinomycetota bacterium]
MTTSTTPATAGSASSAEPTASSTGPTGSTQQMLSAPDDDERGDRQPAWVIVAGREIIVRLTDKNFIVSTVVTLALLAGSFGLQVALSGGGTSASVVVAGPGARDVMTAVDRLAVQRQAPVELTLSDAADPAAVESAVRDGSADLGLVHDGTTWQLVARETPDAGLAALVRDAVQQQTLTANAAAAGTTAAALTAGSRVDERLLAPTQDENTKYAVSFVFAFLFYMASLLFGMTIASSVVEEKQSRVVEILVSSVSVRQLLLGKVAGNTVLAMLQMVLFVGIGLVGVSFTDYRTILPSLAAASGWFLVFFLAGFVSLACLWAAAGALATRNEDLQSTTPALTTVLVGTLILGLVARGTVQVVASYVPVVSTIAMPLRLFAGTASWWEPVLSLALTCAFAFGAVVLGERLYSRSLLQTQRRLSVREALRLAR